MHGAKIGQPDTASASETTGRHLQVVPRHHRHGSFRNKRFLDDPSFLINRPKLPNATDPHTQLDRFSHECSFVAPVSHHKKSFSVPLHVVEAARNPRLRQFRFGRY
jgi:hypothetical protein